MEKIMAKKTFTVRLHITANVCNKVKASKGSGKRNWSFNDRRAKLLTSPLRDVEFVQLSQD